MKAMLLAAAFGVLSVVSAQAQSAPAVNAASSAPRVDAEGPQVTMQTDMGDVVLALDRVNAPKTVANFLRYVRAGYFNNIQIYRIERDFVIQMGGLTAAGKNRPALYPPIPLESGLPHARGAVAMARGEDPNSASQTFYIDLAANAALSAKPDAPPNTTGYAVFGHVIAGMDVVDAIGAAELGGDGPFPGKAPKTPIIVKKIAVTKE
ncbi:MAG: peptidylprolyl isomerase [Hyphomonadaceae bacterium]